MANKLFGFLEAVGKDFMKGLGFAVKFAPAASALASILYPPAAAIAPEVIAATDLLQKSIIAIEQKYAASGVQKGTGMQKTAEVLALAGPAVTSLLSAPSVEPVLSHAGISVDISYIQSLVTAVVGILNVHTAPEAAAAA